LTTSLAIDGIVPRRGRPRKFAGPSRAVTLTLPEDVIELLESVDRDLSRAVVQIAQPGIARRPRPPAELAAFGRKAVIVVTPSATLASRVGVLLIPLADGRALIAFDESMTTARLELRIQDEIDARQLAAADARVFKGIRELLKAARRSKDVVLQQRNIIVLEYAGGTGARRPRPRSGTRPVTR
jgi:hypothetical protein